MKNKALITVFSIMALAIISQSIYFNYKLKLQRGFVEKEIQAIKDSISVIDIKEAKIISKGKTVTNKASANKKTINQKLKADEKAIYNSPVTDERRKRYLAKHKK